MRTLPKTLFRFTLLCGFVLCSTRALAQSDSVDDYVIFANRRVEVGRVALIASGNVGTQDRGGLFAAQRQLISGHCTHIVSDGAAIKGPASLYSLWANDTEHVDASVAIQSPGEPAGFPPPVLGEFPAVPLISAGTPPVQTKAFQTLTLPPGAYGALRMRQRSTLVLTGGEYTFASVKTGMFTRILFTAPTVVNVADSVLIGPYSLISPITPGVRAADIWINVAGDLVRIRKRNTVAARFLAPQARVSIGAGVLFKGQLIGDEVSVALGAAVQAAAPVCESFLRRTPTHTPVPPTPTGTPTRTPTAVIINPTETPLPTSTVAIPTNTAVPPTNSPAVPTVTNTPVSTEANTSVPTPTHTSVPSATHTGVPSAAATPTAIATDTAVAAATNTPVPTSAGGMEATPTFTSQPAFTATPRRTEASGSPSATPGGEPVVCGNGVREGGEECDDGNGDDDDGCSNECRSDHDDGSLGQRFCTLTQGAWGSPNGIGNGPDGFVTRYPGILPVTIGGPGQSTEVQTQSALIAYLPHGGGAAPLYPGQRYFNTAASVSDDGGGVLAGQAMSATLAVNLSAELGDAYGELEDFELPEHRFCTQAMLPADDGVLGTDDDVLDAGGTITQWRLPECVRVAGNSVEDLLNMANQYLRGGGAPPDMTEISEALETINQAFDECRQIVPCP